MDESQECTRLKIILFDLMKVFFEYDAEVSEMLEISMNIIASLAYRHELDINEIFNHIKETMEAMEKIKQSAPC